MIQCMLPKAEKRIKHFEITSAFKTICYEQLMDLHGAGDFFGRKTYFYLNLSSFYLNLTIKDKNNIEKNNIQKRAS